MIYHDKHKEVSSYMPDTNSDSNKKRLALLRKEKPRTIIVGRKTGRKYAPQGHFQRDLSIARETEYQMAHLLRQILDDRENGIICSFEGQCSTSDWDFSMGYRNMAISKKQGIRFNVEVKENQKCHHTGNVGLEFMCSGKPSGIETTKADFYVYHIHTPETQEISLLLSVKDLKTAIQNKRYQYIRPTVRDGEDRPAHNYIFGLPVFKDIAVCELNMDNLENIICVRNYFNELAKKHLGA